MWEGERRLKVRLRPHLENDSPALRLRPYSFLYLYITNIVLWYGIHFIWSLIETFHLNDPPTVKPTVTCLAGFVIGSVRESLKTA